MVAGLVVAADAELATLRTQWAALQEAIVDWRRQRDRHSGNSGPPPSQDGPSARRALRGRLLGAGSQGFSRRHWLRVRSLG